TLVREQADEVCRKPCPTGQGLSAEGRCLPNAILARRSTQVVTAALAHKPQPPAPPSPATIGSLAISAAPRAPALEGRMALAGPKAEAPTPRARPARTAMAALPAAYRPFRRPHVVSARRSPPSRVAWRSGRGGWVGCLFFRRTANGGTPPASPVIPLACGAPRRSKRQRARQDGNVLNGARAQLLPIRPPVA